MIAETVMKDLSSTQVKFRRASPLPEQVADFLISEIETGSLKRGEKLPTEAELARQFGVSRTVIREAFARLKQDGLLDSKHGDGARVAGSSQQKAFRLGSLEDADPLEIGQLFELRSILEGDAAALAAGRHSDKDVERLSRCIGLIELAVKQNDGGTDADLDFHQILAEASGNVYLRDLMRFLSDKLRDLIRRARDHSSVEPGLSDEAYREHVALFEAIVRKDAVGAKEAALVHIKRAARRLGFDLPNPL